MHLSSYIKSRRGVGHTTLMKKGLDNYDKPFYVVGGTFQHSRELAKANPNAIPITRDGGSKIMGTDYPVIMDAYAITMMVEDLENKVRVLGEENKNLRRKYNDFRYVVSTMNFLERLFNFKNKIKTYL